MEKDIEQLCFDLFKKTGNPAHYMLYQALKDRDKTDGN